MTLQQFQLTCPMRGTTQSLRCERSSKQFQLTCPMRGTTLPVATITILTIISTHVPHAGHDLPLPDQSAIALTFQLTCPMRGTTTPPADCAFAPYISTHVPHAGHDRTHRRLRICSVHFNSRAPCGARPHPSNSSSSFLLFQLTCPMRGTTFFYCYELNGKYISTHVPHAGHDRSTIQQDE